MEHAALRTGEVSGYRAMPHAITCRFERSAVTVRRAIVPVFMLCVAIARSTAAQTAGADELYSTHGRYLLRAGDVFEVQYRLSPEFNQTVTVQPDGFVMLQVAGEVR